LLILCCGLLVIYTVKSVLTEPENGFKEGLQKAIDQYGADTEISTGMDDLQRKV
jgi:hypothetical protein